MLTLNSNYFKTVLKFFVLLFFISLSSYHAFVYAQEEKEPTAEEYHIKGYGEQQKGNLDKALFYYNKAIALGLENAAILNDMGVLSEQMGFNKQAEKFYLKALDIDRDYLATYTNLAYFYLKNGPKGKSVKFFKRRYELSDPSDPWAQKSKNELIKIDPENRDWIVAVETERMKKDMQTQEEKKFLDDVANIKKMTKEHSSLGQKYFTEGKYKESIDEYNLAIGLSPLDLGIKGKRNKAKLELINSKVLGHWDKAIKMLKQGDNVSAKEEVKKILAIIPDRPILSQVLH